MVALPVFISVSENSLTVCNNTILHSGTTVVLRGAIRMAIERSPKTQRPFADAFAEIMREKYGDNLGNFDLRPVLSQVDGYSYEALRLMLRGERTLKMGAIEGIAKVVGVSPHYFVEYRRMWSAAMAETHPELADIIYEAALRFV